MLLEKRYGALHPFSDEAAEQLLAMPSGVYEVSIKRKRNPQFFRKYHALIDVLFEMWTPEQLEYNGKPVVKNRTRFRKDIAIATGNHDLVVNIKGEVKAEAKSIAFDKMGEDEFEMLYSRTIDYALLKIVNGSKQQIENCVSQIMDFT